MRRFINYLLVLAMIFALIPAGTAFAAEYPSEKITVIVPWGAGGGTDRWTRTLSTVAIDHYGQPFHIINMPGASGMVGWQELLKKPADGYYMMSTGTSNIIAPLIDESAPYRPDQIVPITIMDFQDAVLLAQPDKAWSTWEGMETYLKENPGKLTIGSVLGISIAAASILDQANLDANIVIYDSTGTTITDLLGGHIDIAVPPPSVAGPLIEDGSAVSVVNIGVEDIEDPLFKDVPSAADLGYQGFSPIRWIGMHPDTPDDIVEYASNALGEMIKSRPFQTIMEKMGEKPIYLPLEETKEVYIRQMEIVDRMLKKLDYKNTNQ